MDVVEESLMGLSGTRIILFLINVAFHREGEFGKMFGDKACGKAMS